MRALPGVHKLQRRSQTQFTQGGAVCPHAVNPCGHQQVWALLVWALLPHPQPPPQGLTLGLTLQQLSLVTLTVGLGLGLTLTLSPLK